ncbi:MAG: helix-turn-helix domain-containing protein [Myxococcales bacterium]
MEPTKAEWEALREQLDRIERKLDELLSHKRRPPRALLSFAQAASMLGVSRNDTLHELVACKRIRAIRINGRWKVPWTEIERVMREGI